MWKVAGLVLDGFNVKVSGCQGRSIKQSQFAKLALSYPRTTRCS